MVLLTKSGKRDQVVIHIKPGEKFLIITYDLIVMFIKSKFRYRKRNKTAGAVRIIQGGKIGSQIVLVFFPEGFQKTPGPVQMCLNSRESINRETMCEKSSPK